MLISYKKPRGRFFVVGGKAQPVVEWTVIISSGANGTVSVDGVTGDYSATVPDGTVLEIEATASEHYSFSQWSDGSTSATRTVTVTGDLNLTASFAIDTYMVNIIAGDNGSVSVNGTPGDYIQTVSYGTVLTVEATPSTGYGFTAWSDGSSANPRTVTVTGDVTLSAAFAIQTFSVSLSAGNNGSISVNGTPVVGTYTDTVNYGTTLTLTATANNGYQFSQWSDGNSGNPRSLTVTSAVTLTAGFQAVAQQADELWYTSSGGNVVTPNDPTAFGGATITSNTYSGGLGIIKFDQTLTDIGLEAFRNCSGLTSVTFGSGVTTIGEGAFRGCTGLTSIVIPDNVTTLAKLCFFDCINATSLTVGSGVSSIGNEAFSFTRRLSTITVDANNTTYDSRNSCNAIVETATNKLVVGCKDTVMPSSVTSTHFASFSGCSNMPSITIGSGITAFGNSTFNKCTSLASITFSSTTTVPTLGTNVFKDVASTGTVYGQSGLNYSTIMAALPSGWALVQPHPNNEIWYTTSNSQTIAPYNLRGVNDNILTVVSNTYSGGKGVIKMSGDIYGTDNSFASQPALTSLSFPSSLTYIGDGCFIACSNLVSFDIPASVTSIGQTAFQHCSSLTSITIPNSVTSIGSSAFANTGLTSVTIGNSVTSIGDYTFFNCTSLVAIESLATTAPTISNATFRSVGNNGTLTVPSGSDYSAWMSTGSYYLGFYRWTLVEQ